MKTYQLIKYRKTNQSTCINLKPIVRKGDRVTKGQVLCEGDALHGRIQQPPNGDVEL